MPPNNKGKMRENARSEKEDANLELHEVPTPELRLSRIEDGTMSDFSPHPPNHQKDGTQQTSTCSFLQRLPSNPSGDRAQGGFFEGPTDKVEIKGGVINHTLGDYTNVTIHVNSERPEAKNDTPRVYPALVSGFIEWASSFLWTNSREGDNPSERHSPLSLPSQISRHSTAAPFTQGPSTSITIYSPDNSNNIYERHLELKKRGFPLWIPGPSRTLPMPYRRKGIDIGDVGIITPSGGFSFLFNVCLPPDHPINPPTLPEGFAPIHPPIQLMDICEYSAFNPESHLASAIEKINDPQFPGLSFVTSAAEGAVLTLPDGAIARDFENISRFRVYAAANIENWYRYANGPRGREAKNGEIRLVYGCDKATSWGMAAVANMTQEKTHYLKYRSLADGGVAPAPIPLYRWEYTGLAEARVGPELREIENLKRNDDSDADALMEGRYWNQSPFIRTLNLTVNKDVFAKINQEVEVALTEELQQYRNKGGSGRSTGKAPNTSTSTSGMNNAAKECASISRSPSAPISHPADVLNKLLLQKVPNGLVVITEDESWCSVINEDDDIMPSPSEIAERVLAAHHIRIENDVVFLEPKAARFLCTVPGCNSTFPRQSNLEGHLLSHDKYKCKSCHEQFTTIDALYEHSSRAGAKCVKAVESALEAGAPKATTPLGTTQSTTTIDNSEVMIAVMGTRGSGKTTFVNVASGSNLRVGGGFGSCTDIIQVAKPFMLNGRSVTLIDTPGFDDTTKSDIDILHMTAAFLATAYENNKKLSGVIYIHRISDIRMGGISTRNFRMFRQLCGDSTLQNVVIVTNMWSEVSLEVGEAREAELANQDLFFKPVLDKGALFLRHENTRQSAHAILQHIIQNYPLSLQIQRELVDEKKNISQTAAGTELNKELMLQIQKHGREMQVLQEEMRGKYSIPHSRKLIGFDRFSFLEAIRTQDEESRHELEAETHKLQEEMNRVRADVRRLASQYNGEKGRLER